MRFCVVVILLFLAGCGGQNLGRPEMEKVVPVTGTATFDGKPLPSFQVVFQPDGGRKPGTAITDENGNFKLGTNADGDGCPPGPCKVSVAFAPPSGDGLGDAIDDPSKLPKPTVKVPAKFANPETSGITVEVPASGLKDYKLDIK